MSIKDLENFSFAVPHYRFNPSPSIISTLYALNVPVEHQIWTCSSDVRICRNHAIAEYFKADHLSNDVLIMCDQDSKIDPEMVEQLVIACSQHSPIIGSNMIYRNSKEGLDVNWFLPNDNGIQRAEILGNPLKFNEVITAELIGFGLVALHRSALEKMIDKFGTAYQGGQRCPILFSEYKAKNPDISSEDVEKGLKVQLRPNYLSDNDWNKLWDELVKEPMLYSYNNKFPSIIYPETYSFCLRAKELNIPIKVYLGIRPGNIEEKALYSQYHLKPETKLSQKAYDIQTEKQKNILREIEL